MNPKVWPNSCEFQRHSVQIAPSISRIHMSHETYSWKSNAIMECDSQTLEHPKKRKKTFVKLGQSPRSLASKKHRRKKMEKRVPRVAKLDLCISKKQHFPLIGGFPTTPPSLGIFHPDPSLNFPLSWRSSGTCHQLFHAKFMVSTQNRSTSRVQTLKVKIFSIFSVWC